MGRSCGPLGFWHWLRDSAIPTLPPPRRNSIHSFHFSPLTVWVVRGRGVGVGVEGWGT